MQFIMISIFFFIMEKICRLLFLLFIFLSLHFFFFFTKFYCENDPNRERFSLVFSSQPLVWASRGVAVRYNAWLCESIRREVGGDVTAHRIQMWNVVVVR